MNRNQKFGNTVVLKSTKVMRVHSFNNTKNSLNTQSVEHFTRPIIA